MRINKYTLPAFFLQWSIKTFMMEAAASKLSAEDCSDTASHTSCNITNILTRILQGYDRGLRPFLKERKPATITVGIWILSIDAINVIDMDYRIDLFFRQQWVDPRLVHSYRDTLTIDNSMLGNIWVPDTYFENSKSSNFHVVTVPNKMLRISQNGTVMYNARISLRASCSMDLLDFPVDTQHCQLHIGSYGYDVRNIKYKWEEGKQRVSIDEKVKHLPQYNLTDFHTSCMVSKYVVGNWSTLKFKFTLRREAGHFLLHLYAPCILVVTLSWIAFFIPRDSVAARIALGITSVLTTTTIMNIQNNSMPKVSYLKLADWYLIVCFLFVFGTLVEFTVILYLSGKEKRKERRSETKKELLLANSKVFPKTNVTETVYGYKSSVSFQMEREERDQKALCEDEEEKLVKSCLAFTLDHIDEYARVFFPVSFIIFNAVYWLLFLHKI